MASGDDEAVVRGDLQSLADLVRTVQARNDLIVRLAGTVETLTNEVRGLRREIDDRPTSDELAHRRRRVIAQMLLFGSIIIFGHDQHVEHCSPGSQANAVVDYIIDHPAKPLTARKFQAIVNESQPTVLCDVTFPFHTHGVHDRSDDIHQYGPLEFSDANAVGALLYLLVGGMVYLWQRAPRRRIQHRKE